MMQWQGMYFIFLLLLIVIGLSWGYGTICRMDRDNVDLTTLDTEIMFAFSPVILFAMLVRMFRRKKK